MSNNYNLKRQLTKGYHKVHLVTHDIFFKFENYSFLESGVQISYRKSSNMICKDKT